MSDVRWWKEQPFCTRRDAPGEVPGDTGAADIVGPTGEEMPDVAHDEGRPVAPTDPSSMPRADDHPDGVEGSSDFHDRRDQGSRTAEH
jgi:hypothetical protein